MGADNLTEQAKNLIKSIRSLASNDPNLESIIATVNLMAEDPGYADDHFHNIKINLRINSKQYKDNNEKILWEKIEHFMNLAKKENQNEANLDLNQPNKTIITENIMPKSTKDVSVEQKAKQQLDDLSRNVTTPKSKPPVDVITQLGRKATISKPKILSAEDIAKQMEQAMVFANANENVRAEMLEKIINHQKYKTKSLGVDAEIKSFVIEAHLMQLKTKLTSLKSDESLDHTLLKMFSDYLIKITPELPHEDAVKVLNATKDLIDKPWTDKNFLALASKFEGKGDITGAMRNLEGVLTKSIPMAELRKKANALMSSLDNMDPNRKPDEIKRGLGDILENLNLTKDTLSYANLQASEAKVIDKLIIEKQKPIARKDIDALSIFLKPGALISYKNDKKLQQLVAAQLSELTKEDQDFLIKKSFESFQAQPISNEFSEFIKLTARLHKQGDISFKDTLNMLSRTASLMEKPGEHTEFLTAASKYKSSMGGSLWANALILAGRAQNLFKTSLGDKNIEAGLDLLNKINSKAHIAEKAKTIATPPPVEESSKSAETPKRARSSIVTILGSEDFEDINPQDDVSLESAGKPTPIEKPKKPEVPASRNARQVMGDFFSNISSRISSFLTRPKKEPVTVETRVETRLDAASQLEAELNELTGVTQEEVNNLPKVSTQTKRSLSERIYEVGANLARAITRTKQEDLIGLSDTTSPSITAPSNSPSIHQDLLDLTYDKEWLNVHMLVKEVNDRMNQPLETKTEQQIAQEALDAVEDFMSDLAKTKLVVAAPPSVPEQRTAKERWASVAQRVVSPTTVTKAPSFADLESVAKEALKAKQTEMKQAVQNRTGQEPEDTHKPKQ